MKVFVGFRRPEVPGFCPSIGAEGTEVTARAPKPGLVCITGDGMVRVGVGEGKEDDGAGCVAVRVPLYIFFLLSPQHIAKKEDGDSRGGGTAAKEGGGSCVQDDHTNHKAHAERRVEHKQRLTISFVPESKHKCG